ncbi:MAG: DUF922 domain-containing protein [Bacteroidia bacterium]
MRLIYLLLVFLGVSSFQPDQKILWSENRKLTWGDFRGKVNESSPYKANTETEVAIQIKAKGEEAVVTLECFFIKDASWTKTRDNVYLLAHEQTHFNITEIGARKFRKMLAGKTFAVKNFQQELKKMHSEVGRESKALQAEYDKETEHSVNEAAQKKWNTKIENELLSLNKFASFNVSCKLSK